MLANADDLVATCRAAVGDAELLPALAVTVLPVERVWLHMPGTGLSEATDGALVGARLDTAKLDAIHFLSLRDAAM